MIGPKTQQLLILADELATKMGQGTVFSLVEVPVEEKGKINRLFENQREFGRNLYRKIRTLRGELDGDLFTLRARGFDPNIWRLAAKVKGELEKILTTIKENNPHAGGQQFVEFVLNKPYSSIIDNLDFLAQHHLNKTKDELGTIPSIGKPVEVNSFRRLKELALETKAHMEQNPPLPIPIPSTIPPPPNPIIDPGILAPPDAETKV
jgi:hypothetical protein